MKTLLIAIAAAWLASLSLGQNAPANQFCPVTPSDPSEPDIYTQYEGQTIYFCCKSCLRDFNKDPQAYLSNLDISSGKEPVHGDHQPGESKTHSHESGEHDHSSHHDETNPLLALFGKLHVVVVHFPIALVPFAAVLAIARRISGKTSLDEAADYAFYAGTLAAIVAAIMGWVAASQSSYPGTLSSYLVYHRWLGTTVAVLAIATSAYLFKRKQSPYRLTIYGTLAVLVLVTAHFGGSLIYGPNYLIP